MELQFSVITPSYNQGRYLEKNIKSVLYQNYPNFEHIVIDGGSTDHTVEILKNYSHLQWESEPDNGQSHALNKGLARAKGDIIAWLNSDDWYEPGTFQRVADFFERNPDKAVVMGNCNLVNEQGEIFKSIINTERGLPELEQFWVENSIPTQPTIFFRRSLLEECGVIDESLHYAMDYDLWIRFAKEHRFYHIDQTFANYLFHTDSKSGAEDWTPFQNEWRTIYHRHCKPKISVVIPCYNYEDYVLTAINSIFEQTYQGFEVIVVDDGSTDDSISLIEEFIQENPSFRVRIFHQPNSGHPSFARNVGITHADGEYILPLDADDLILPTMLEECAAVLEENRDLSIAYTDHVTKDKEENVSVDVHDEYDLQKLLKKNFLCYCALFRKKAWIEAGGYQRMGYEDWEFWISCGLRGHTGKRVPKPLFVYRSKDSGQYAKDLEKDEMIRAEIILRHRSQYSPEEVMQAVEKLQGNTSHTEPIPQERVVTVSELPIVHSRSNVVI